DELPDWQLSIRADATGGCRMTEFISKRVATLILIGPGLEPHDCFVTAGNSFGIMTAGIDAAVVRFFGEQLMQKVQHRIMDDFFGEQPVGTAFVLPTGHCAIPFIAHSPTMRVPGSIEGTDKVYNATWAALLAMHAHNRVSQTKIEVAVFPAMGTGFGGVPYE